MASIFPALIPADRTYLPEQSVSTTHRTYNGKQTRVKHSNAKTNARVRLFFPALPTVEMLEIVGHHREQLGRFASFPVPDEIFNGMDFPADFTPGGSLWTYVAKPAVIDIPIAGGAPSNRHNVTVELRSSPALPAAHIPRFRWRLTSHPPSVQIVSSYFGSWAAQNYGWERDYQVDWWAD
jgi:hypothetical protein